MTENANQSFEFLKEWDLTKLDLRRAELVRDGHEGLPDELLLELVAVSAQIRLRSGKVPKAEQEKAPRKTPVKNASSLEDLDL